MNRDLVIFDCDGVLVDSETISCRLDAELFTELGFPTTFEDIRRDFVGVSASTMCRTIEERFGRKLPEDMPQRLLRAVLEAFETQLQPIRGIAQALDALEAPRCVASSSDPARIRRSLELTGLIGHFDPHLFSTKIVARGKPAPDIFLFAARTMGAEPARCVVIEDSVPGVTAARAAGMTVLGFVGGDHCPPGHDDKLRALGADHVFADMRALPALLATL
ncbi:MAG: HAD family hydrolase [Alphaproteobacteria bacterium]|nr:HAD family hydrolase [Alphaproteobacteria bacterium]